MYVPQRKRVTGLFRRETQRLQESDNIRLRICLMCTSLKTETFFDLLNSVTRDLLFLLLLPLQVSLAREGEEEETNDDDQVKHVDLSLIHISEPTRRS